MGDLPRRDWREMVRGLLRQRGGDGSAPPRGGRDVAGPDGRGPRGGVCGRFVGSWPGRAAALSVLGVLGAATFFFSGCPDGTGPKEIAAVAVVNGQSIGVDEFARALGEAAALATGGVPLKPEETESLREEVLGNLVREKIMIQRARALAVAVDDAELAARVEEIRKDYGDEFERLFAGGDLDLQQWREALRRRMLLEKLVTREVNAKIRVSDTEAERHFNDHRRLYAAERRVRVAQIVLHDRARAEGVLKRLKAGEDFAKVAREVSIGPEAAAGGDLGYLERGAMPGAIDRVVFSLPVGKVSRVVQSPYGFHICKVLERDAAGGRSFADLKQRVAADLRKIKEAEAYQAWLEGLLAQAEIRIQRPLPQAPPPAAAGRDATPAATVPER